MNFIKFFMKEYILKDDQTILVGFYIEIMQNCKNNSISTENYDDSVIYFYKLAYTINA